MSQINIGHYETRLPITIGREPEVGIAWEACCGDQCALGKTPHDAVEGLLAGLRRRGIEGHAEVDLTGVE
jgi:hypothetical protein